MHEHGAALATVELYERVIAAVRDGAGAAIPGIEVTDTIKVVERNADGGIDGGPVVSTPDRSTLVRCRHLRRSGRLRFGRRTARPARRPTTPLVEAFGGRVVVVAGDRRNRKITEPDDLG